MIFFFKTFIVILLTGMFWSPTSENYSGEVLIIVSRKEKLRKANSHIFVRNDDKIQKIKRNRLPNIECNKKSIIEFGKLIDYRLSKVTKKSITIIEFENLLINRVSHIQRIGKKIDYRMLKIEIINSQKKSIIKL